MITKVFGFNFKGIKQFEQLLEQRTIFSGPNGSGKTVRSQAIMLTILGYVPGVNRTAPEIHNAFATAPQMAVAVEVGGKIFKRVFEKKTDGAIHSTMYVDKKKVAARDFPAELVIAGCPEVYQADAFLNLSKQEKLKEMTRRFPPAGNLDNVTAQIAAIKNRINDMQRRKEGLKSSISELQADRARMNMPSDALSGVEKEIALNASNLEAAIKLKGEILKAKEDEERNARKKEEQKKDQRKTGLFNIGLKFNGQDFYYKTFKRPFADFLFLTDEDFAVALEELRNLKASIDEEEKRLADEKIREDERKRISDDALKAAEEKKKKAEDAKREKESAAAKQPEIVIIRPRENIGMPAIKPSVSFTPVLPCPASDSKLVSALNQIEQMMQSAGCTVCSALVVLRRIKRENSGGCV